MHLPKSCNLLVGGTSRRKRAKTEYMERVQSSEHGEGSEQDPIVMTAKDQGQTVQLGHRSCGPEEMIDDDCLLVHRLDRQSSAPRQPNGELFHSAQARE